MSAQEAGKTDAGLAPSGDRVRKPLLLGRKSVLLGMLTSGFVVAGAAQASSASAGTTKPSSLAATQSSYVPKWAPSTTYAGGQQVVSPNNDVVSANVAHTSSAGYALNTAKWTLSSTYALVDGVIGSADFVVTQVGATITATPRSGSGLTKYSGSDASTVIQSAIDALTQTGSRHADDGGKIYIAHGNYSLTSELTINGWGPSYVNPLSQLVIQGDGSGATQLSQNTSGQNGLVVKNGASFGLMDIGIFTNSNAKSCLLLDNTGTNTEWSCTRGVINNVHLSSNSTTQPTAIFRNFFDLSVPMLEVQSNSRSCLVLENLSSTTNFGNSHFGFLRCNCANAASPNAGLSITTNSGNHFMNLLTFDNYECTSAYYGIYTIGANYCKWGFVDLEYLTKPIYFDGTAGGFGYESRNNEISDGYLAVSGTDTAITQTLYTGGNKVSAIISSGSTVVPVADASNWRPANRYDLNTDSTAANLITLVNPATDLILTFDDGTIFKKQRFTTKTSTAYALDCTDAGTTIEMNSASVTKVTVTANATKSLPIGTTIEVVRLGAGIVSLVADTGVTIRSAGNLLSIASQYGSVFLRKRAINEWVLTGNLA